MAPSTAQPKTEHGTDEAPTVVRSHEDRPITYATYGASEGVPVLFLHGTPGSRHLGALLEPAAREFGVRILAPDRPGYGRSSPWPDRSIDDAAAVLTPILDDAGVESAGVVAFSGGGPHALAMAATASDRVDRVDVVAGATPPGLRETQPAIQRLLATFATRAPTVLSGLVRGQAWLADRLDARIVVGQYTDDPEAVPAPVADVVEADFREALARTGRGTVTEFRTAATDWPIDLADVDVDVGLWHGTADTNVPIAGARRLAGKIPSADLRTLEDADHLQTLLRSRRDVLERYR